MADASAGLTLVGTGEGGPGALADEVARIIDGARREATRATNVALTMLHWQIGARIRQDVLAARRAEYGAEVIVTLGRQLEARFGRGFGEKNLRRMVQFAEAFPDGQIVVSLIRQLTTVEYLDLGRDGIHVAEYLTELPPRDVLRKRFQRAIAAARARANAAAES